MTSSELVKIGLIGRWRDVVSYRDGSVVEGEWCENQIQNTASTLVIALLRRFFDVDGHSTFTGCAYLAVGSGDISWDSVSPVKSRAQAALTSEVFRKAIDVTDISFLDGDDEESLTPTRTLQVVVSLDFDEANFTLREFGIFGGEATGAADSGLMLNWISHPRIDKDNSLSITRTIRISAALPS